MKKLLSLMTLAIGLLASLVIAGCGGNSADKTNAGHLNLAIYWFGESVDPAHGWDGWTVIRVGAGETLITVNEKMEFVPQLADKWENINPTTWSFHIRPGVKFQNGDELTPDLVKSSLERTMSENQRLAKAARIKEMRIDGENLVIETVEPYASLIPTLTDPAFIIVNTKKSDTIATAPILTGPYTITAFKKGEEIQMKRNEYYWNGTPKLNTITVKHVGDDSKRAMGLQSGEFDLIQRLSAANRPLFENKPEYKIYETTGTRNFMLTMNQESIFADKNLREGVAYLLDYDMLAAAYGSALPAGEPFPPSVPYGHPGIKTSMNKEKASAAFAAAGYKKNAQGMYEKNGDLLSIQFATWGTETAYYEAIESQLREGGVTVKMVHVQEPAMVDSVGGFDLLEENWTVVATNDSYWWLNNMFHSGSPTNRGHFNSPAFDKIVDEIAVAVNPDRKAQLETDAARILVEEIPTIFVVFPTVSMVGKANVKNVPIFPMDYYIITKDISVE